MIILGKDKVDERYNISDDGIITDLQGNVQKTKKERYEFFHRQRVHLILMWTRFGYRDTKIWCVHHLDENKFNNNINNLEFKTKSDHASLHVKNNKNLFGGYKFTPWLKGKHLPEYIKRKISQTLKNKKSRFNPAL